MHNLRIGLQLVDTTQWTQETFDQCRGGAEQRPRFQRSDGFFQRYSGFDPEYNQSRETADVLPKLVRDLA